MNANVIWHDVECGRYAADLPLWRELAREAGDGPLYALPTYTALLELRDLLARRGQAEEYWR